MHNRHFRPDSLKFCDTPEGQIISDPFAPVARSKTAEHEKRFLQSEISQNLLKNEEIES